MLRPFGTELYHYGIKGQKWGVRRYQNSDGSLTTVGKKRYSNPSPDQTELYNSIAELSKTYLSVSDEIYKNARTSGPIRRPYATKTEMAYDTTAKYVRSIKGVQNAYYDVIQPKKLAVTKAKETCFKNRFKSNLDKYLNKLQIAEKQEKEARQESIDFLLGPYANKKWCNSEDFGSADMAVKNITYGTLLDRAFKDWEDYPYID